MLLHRRKVRVVLDLDAFLTRHLLVPEPRVLGRIALEQRVIHVNDQTVAQILPEVCLGL